jgi:multisubunit Na+/H+ antiporter MnhG subunit
MDWVEWIFLILGIMGLISVLVGAISLYRLLDRWDKRHATRFLSVKEMDEIKDKVAKTYKK